MAKLFLVFVLAISGFLTILADKDVNEGDINVKVLGKSGKISAKNKKGNSVVILFDYIKELSAANTTVGARGRKKHSINTFAKEDFAFKTQGLKTEYQNISARSIQFEANMSGPGAKLTVDVYIFKAAGTVITANGEEISVTNGTIKFDINITDWTFCGGSDGEACKAGSSNEEGTSLEFGIEIKARGKPKEKSKKRGKGRKMKTLDIGSADCTLSGQVNKDGVWEEMAENYPKVETKGPKTLFIFRFPRFQNSVFYDPTLDMSTGPGGFASSIKGHIALVTLCALLVALKLIA